MYQIWQTGYSRTTWNPYRQIQSLLRSNVRKKLKEDYFNWERLGTECPIIHKLLDEMNEDQFPEDFVAIIIRLCDIDSK